jgi:hypothetical protein
VALQNAENFTVFFRPAVAKGGLLLRNSKSTPKAFGVRGCKMKGNCWKKKGLVKKCGWQFPVPDHNRNLNLNPVFQGCP